MIYTGFDAFISVYFPMLSPLDELICTNSASIECSSVYFLTSQSVSIVTVFITTFTFLFFSFKTFTIFKRNFWFLDSLNVPICPITKSSFCNLFSILNFSISSWLTSIIFSYYIKLGNIVYLSDLIFSAPNKYSPAKSLHANKFVELSNINFLIKPI